MDRGSCKRTRLDPLRNFALGLAVPTENFANFVACSKESRNYRSVPLLASSLAKDLIKTLFRHPLPIGPVAAHGVECIRDGHNSGHYRDFFTGEFIRISAAVPLL